MNILIVVSLVFMVFMALVLLFVFIFSAGGSYLKLMLKEKLPWNKGRGKKCLFVTKTAQMIFDYVIPDKNGMIKFRNWDPMIIEDTTHKIKTKFKQPWSTIHNMDGEPIYVFVEGNPTNVIVQSRDYEEDIEKIKEIIATIKTMKTSTDVDNKIKIIYKLKDKLRNLQQAFKYLPKAQQVIKSVMATHQKLDEVTPENIDTYLDEYYKAFSVLYLIMKDKTNSLVNFKEFFNSSNLSKIFATQFQLSFISGVLYAQKKQKQSPFANISNMLTIVILVLVFICFALLFSQNGTIKDMQLQIQSMNNGINEIQNVVVPPKDIISDVDLIKSNTPSPTG